MSVLLDTEADNSIRHCINERQSFAVIAGAGSGKTTSLTSALQYVRRCDEPSLRQKGQRIVCITYTKRAVEVLRRRVDWDDLFYISTIHSFLWEEIRRFQSAIRSTIISSIIPTHIARARKNDDGRNNQKSIKARETIAALEGALVATASVPIFEYRESVSSSYANGSLSHDDIIDIAATMISTNALLQRIIGQKYPFIFVDEAQDTFVNVVSALNTLAVSMNPPVVGYFGDPMQQIYENRAGNFGPPDNGVVITKSENFRCSLAVIDLLNRFRADVHQYAAGSNTEVPGSVLVTLVQSEAPTGLRGRYSEEQVVAATSRFFDALATWGLQDDAQVKWLFLTRQMIARRLGFQALQNLFTGEFSSSRSQDDFAAGIHFLIKPFIQVIVPLVRAFRSDNFRSVIDILRAESPGFDPEGVNSKRRLDEMRKYATSVASELSSIWLQGTTKEVLQYCQSNKLCSFSERLVENMARAPRPEAFSPALYELEKSDWLADEFFRMRTVEIEAYTDFIAEHTPLSTQHGVKGEEYKNVIVVFDDIEAAWNSYSFAKMLVPGTAGAPTERQLEMSRKLAYVCFSRAEENLRILLFTQDATRSREELILSRLFAPAQISILKSD